MCKISVIIPAYNSEATIEMCVRSVLAQDFPSLEVIIVDDGSTDETLSLCRQFEDGDSRVRLFHQDNKGVSAARNLGLDMAKGEWITFVDSDDRVGVKYASRMIDCVSAMPSVDLYVGSVNVFRNGERAEILSMDKGVVSCSELDLIFGERALHRHGFPFAKLYKQSLLKRNHIFFDEKQNMAEDCVLLINYILSCSSSDASFVYFDDAANYDYYVKPGSLSTMCSSFDQELYNYNSIKKTFSQLIDRVGSQSAKKELHSSIGWFADRCINATYQDFSGERDKRIKRLKDFDSKDILFRHDETFGQRLLKMLLILGFHNVYDTIRNGKRIRCAVDK